MPIRILVLTMLLIGGLSDLGIAQLPWAWAMRDGSVSYEIGPSAPRTALASSGSQLLWCALQKERYRSGDWLFGEYRVAVIDTNGNPLQATMLYGTMNVIAARSDTAGNWYVLGRFLDSLQVGAAPVIRRSGSSDEYFVLRLSAGSLNLDWYRRLSGNGMAVANNLTMAPPGLYVAVDTLPGTTVYCLDPASGKTIMQLSQTGRSVVKAIVADSSGSLYVLGNCAPKSGIDFNGFRSAPPSYMNSPDFLTHYKPDGSYDWHYWLNSGCSPKDITADGDSGVFLTGDTYDSFSIGALHFPKPLNGNFDYFISRIRRDGSADWGRSRYAPGRNPEYMAFSNSYRSVSSEGALYVFANAGGTEQWGPAVHSANAGLAATVVSFGNAGAAQWAKPITGEVSIGQHIVQAGSALYVAGFAYDSLEIGFDNIRLRTPGISATSGRGLYIPFLAKLGHSAPASIGQRPALPEGLDCGPVPANEQIRIRNRTAATARIIDINGRLQWEGVLRADEQVRISTAAWPRGTYMLCVTDATAHTYRRLTLN